MKKISQLTQDEYIKVMTDNGKEQEIYNDVMDCAYWRVDEYLHGITGVDYEIGVYGYNYIKPLSTWTHENTQLVRDLLDKQKYYCIFTEETEKKLERMNDRAEYAGATAWFTDDGFETWYMDGLQTALDELCNLCVSEYEYHAEHFFEIAGELEYYGNYYVTNAGDLVDSDIAKSIIDDFKTTLTDAIELYNELDDMDYKDYIDELDSDISYLMDLIPKHGTAGARAILVREQ